MRLFQNFDVYSQYLEHMYSQLRSTDYRSIKEYFFDDRFVATHMLLPLISQEKEATFAIGNDERGQRKWAEEHGMPIQSSMKEILLSQIEHHKTEVFYNHDPLRFGSDFVRSLPGSVRHTIAWRAAPSPGADFGAYDWVVCNFPGILQDYSEKGWKSCLFSPAHDPVMDDYNSGNRPIDVTFVGTFSRHHANRAACILSLASLSDSFVVRLHLQKSRLTTLSEGIMGRVLPLGRFKRPYQIRRLDRGPIFGRALYRLFGSSKIVVNGSIDMAGSYRGNMRCWEALGCGALMVSDAGIYPLGFEANKTFFAYDSAADLCTLIPTVIKDQSVVEGVASAGTSMIKRNYNKKRQWNDFLKLL